MQFGGTVGHVTPLAAATADSSRHITEASSGPASEMTKSVAALRVRKQPSDRLKTHPDKELKMLTSFGRNICFVQIDDMCLLKPRDFNSCLVKNYTNHNSEDPPESMSVLPWKQYAHSGKALQMA